MAPQTCAPPGVTEAEEDEAEAEADAHTDAEARPGAVTAEAAAVAEAEEAGRLAGAAGGEPPRVQPLEAGTAWYLEGQPVCGGCQPPGSWSSSVAPGEPH